MANEALEQLLGARYIQYARLVKLDTSIGEDALVPLYVKIHARLGRDFEVIVDALSAVGDSIQFKTLLMQPVTLWIHQTDGSYLPIHGYVQRVRRLGSDGSVSYFQLHFSSWLSFLKLSSDRRDWQEAAGSGRGTDFERRIWLASAGQRSIQAGIARRNALLFASCSVGNRLEFCPSQHGRGWGVSPVRFCEGWQIAPGRHHGRSIFRPVAAWR